MSESTTTTVATTIPRVVSPEQKAREEKLKSMLGKEMRITINDGRVYEGLFPLLSSFLIIPFVFMYSHSLFV